MREQSVSFSSVNGLPSESLGVADRGLAYGDGLFETMRLHNGGIPLLPKHLERLSRGCERLGIPFDRKRLLEHLESQVKLSVKASSNTSGIVKIIYTRGEGGAGYCPPAYPLTSPNIIIQIKPLCLESACDEHGVILHLCETALPLDPLLAGLKHLNRLHYILASREVPIGDRAHGLLVDHNACVIECVHHNLFLYKDNVLRTPCLEQAGVAGVMRAFILDEISPTLFPSVHVEESVIHLADIYSAEEVFLTNSVRGVWHVSEFDHMRWTKGPVVAAIQKKINAFWGSGNDNS